jgi:S-adenosylmethionine uptake transporter
MAILLSNYLKAIIWFVLSLIVSCGNDAIMKYVGTHISPWQVAFFRCFFGTMTLLPLMRYQGRASFKTHRPLLHVMRGVLLFVTISLWSHGVKEAPITTATIMSFTVPIFVLLLAPILAYMDDYTDRFWRDYSCLTTNPLLFP